MATVSNMSIWRTDNAGSSWYYPNSGASYINSNGANNGTCYSFTVTPSAGKKITKISFTADLLKDGSGDGYAARTGYFTAYLYKSSRPSGSALASNYQESEIHYYYHRYPTFTFTIPSSQTITSATTFCVFITGTWCLGYSGVSASASETAVSYTISYNKGANGSGTNTSVTKSHGVNITLPSAIFTRTGYTQTGWSTSDGGSKAYELSAAYSGNANATLYPYWTVNTYTISYASGSYGLGAQTSATKTYGTALTLPNAIFARLHYRQDGWSVNSNGSTKDYNLGASYTGNANATLYPHWAFNALTHVGNGSSFVSYTAYINNGSTWDLYAAYIHDGSKWNLCESSSSFSVPLTFTLGTKLDKETGQVSSTNDSSYNASDYITLESGADYIISTNNDCYNAMHVCYYNSSNTFVGYQADLWTSRACEIADGQLAVGALRIPSGATKIRLRHYETWNNHGGSVGFIKLIGIRR